MDRRWLKSYQPGVPADVNPDRYSSLNEFFESVCAQYAARTAFIHCGHALTYQELEEHSRAWSAYLQKVLAIAKGDRVALMMPNLLQYPILMFGILRAGGVIVNINPLSTPRELEYELRDSGARILVLFEGSVPTLEGIENPLDLKQVLITKMGDFLPFPKGFFMNQMFRYLKKPHLALKKHSRLCRYQSLYLKNPALWDQIWLFYNIPVA